jgi:toxin ParE1/3/4
MKIRYTQRARSDLQHIYTYLYERSPSGALNVRSAIRNTIAQIGQERRQGQATDRPDVRRVPVVRYLYAVYFRIRGNEVEVVHIRHTARQAPGGNEL